MSVRNDLIVQHYLENYDKLVKRTTWRVPNRSSHLAEECVQEAYARALKYFKNFSPSTNTFPRWFDGILRNAINDCRTIEKDRGVSHELEEQFIQAPDKQEQIVAEKIVEDATGITKVILTHFLLHGYKTREISEYTGIKHSTIRQIISRWRIKNGID